MLALSIDCFVALNIVLKPLETKMQQIFNRNLALLIILNCMFSVMIPSRDNLLPCSILEGDQQSDLFCTFVRVSALAIFAKCMYSLYKPTQWNCKKIKSLKLYLKAGVLRQESGESCWYALQSAVQSAKIQFTNHSSLKIFGIMFYFSVYSGKADCKLVIIYMLSGDSLVREKHKL